MLKSSVSHFDDFKPFGRGLTSAKFKKIYTKLFYYTVYNEYKGASRPQACSIFPDMRPPNLVFLKFDFIKWVNFDLVLYYVPVKLEQILGDFLKAETM